MNFVIEKIEAGSISGNIKNDSFICYIWYNWQTDFLSDLLMTVLRLESSEYGGEYVSFITDLEPGIHTWSLKKKDDICTLKIALGNEDGDILFFEECSHNDFLYSLINAYIDVLKKMGFWNFYAENSYEFPLSELIEVVQILRSKTNLEISVYDNFGVVDELIALNIK